MSYNIEELS